MAPKRELHVGAKGGLYYYSKTGKKVYVAKGTVIPVLAKPKFPTKPLPRPPRKPLPPVPHYSTYFNDGQDHRSYEQRLAERKLKQAVGYDSRQREEELGMSLQRAADLLEIERMKEHEAAFLAKHPPGKRDLGMSLQRAADLLEMEREGKIRLSHKDCKQNVVHGVMHDFKHGQLTTHGKPVTNRKQAIAMALNKAKKECAEERGGDTLNRVHAIMHTGEGPKKEVSFTTKDGKHVSFTKSPRSKEIATIKAAQKRANELQAAVLPVKANMDLEYIEAMIASQRAAAEALNRRPPSPESDIFDKDALFKAWMRK